MSQTETLLVLALGSALTFVFFLLFGRVFWGMAVSAGARRNAKRVPVQLLDMQADRDRLRAEHAIMARKLELRVDDIKTRMAEQQAEISRNRNRVQRLQVDVETRDQLINYKEREITALNTQIDVLRADLEATHQTVENLNADALRRDGEMKALQDNFRELGTSLREKNTLVGNLNDELREALAPETATSHVSKDPATHMENRLRQRVAELTSISADMAQNQFDMNSPMANPELQPDMMLQLSSRQAQLSNTVEKASRLSDQMDQELRALDEILDKSSEPLIPAPVKKRTAISNVISLAQRIRSF